MTKLIATLAIGAALALSAGSASAQADEAGAPAFRTRIAHADLDLAEAAGRAKLYRRMRSAASAGCARLYRRDPAALQLKAGCVHLSLAAARGSVRGAIARAGAGRTVVAAIAGR
jgi:UrcA family protein